jgi:hypothetical protein
VLLSPPEFVVPEFVVPEFVVPEFVVPEFVVPEFVVPEFVEPEFVEPVLEPLPSSPSLPSSDPSSELIDLLLFVFPPVLLVLASAELVAVKREELGVAFLKSEHAINMANRVGINIERVFTSFSFESL